jgi:glycosyltransferase involved in cell wall biosynthesis
MGEIMDASGAGMVVDPFSMDAFRSALNLLVKDGPLRMELGARAREFVLCRLSPERECTAWKDLYNSFR